MIVSWPLCGVSVSPDRRILPIWIATGAVLAVGWAVDLPSILLTWIKHGAAGGELAAGLLIARAGYLAMIMLMPPIAAALGFLSGAAVLGAQAKMKDREAGGGWLMLSVVSLLPLVCFWVSREAAQVMGLHPASVRALWPWALGAGLGVGSALAWLRWGAPSVDAMRHRLAKRPDQERNKKTDIRQVRAMLPAGIARFDPVRYFPAQPARRGVFVGLSEDRQPVLIDWETWKLSHVLLSGRTRSGKGVAAQNVLSQAIRAGELVVILDPKGDEWMPHVFHAAAQQAGQPWRYIDLRPHAPAQINPFSQASADEIETILIAAFSLAEKGEAADFYRLADRKAAREAAGLLAEGLSPSEALERSGSSWIERAPGFHAYMQEMAELPCVNGAGLDWRSWAESGGCLYIAGDMINPRVIRMQRLMAARLTLLAKRLQEEGARRQSICLFADEFKVHISRPFMTALGAAAGWGLHCVLAFQSLQDLADVPADLDKDAVRGAVMENCAIQLSYSIKDPETADWLARSTGKIQVDDELRHVERNIALSETVLPERTIRQSERFFIDENMFLMLPKACAVLSMPGELARFVFTAPVQVDKNPAAVAVVPTAPAVGGKDPSSVTVDLTDSRQAVDRAGVEPDADPPKETDGRQAVERADFV